MSTLDPISGPQRFSRAAFTHEDQMIPAMRPELVRADRSSAIGSAIASAIERNTR